MSTREQSETRSEKAGSAPIPDPAQMQAMWWNMLSRMGMPAMPQPQQNPWAAFGQPMTPPLGFPPIPGFPGVPGAAASGESGGANAGMHPMAAANDALVAMLRQYQKAYLDAAAKWCDEYLRSPEFLNSVKQSTDNALALRRQMQEFLKKGFDANISSTLGAGADAVGVMRQMAVDLSRRVDELVERLDRIEEAIGSGGARGSTRGGSTKRGKKTEGSR